MQQLILIRHSAVKIDPARPAHQWPLSSVGRARCHTLATRLAGYRPTVLVSSQEPKACQTAQLLAADLNLSWHTAPNLHEHERHGVPYFSSKDQFEAAVADFFARPDELVLGEETARQAQERFEAAAQQVLIQYPEETVAIVTHGTVTTLLITSYNPDLPPFPFWQTLTLPCAFVLTRPSLTLQTALRIEED